ncbi:hypothetical protein Q5752_005405 [Cryptotrichosporon argae]
MPPSLIAKHVLFLALRQCAATRLAASVAHLGRAFRRRWAHAAVDVDHNRVPVAVPLVPWPLAVDPNATIEAPRSTLPSKTPLRPRTARQAGSDFARAVHHVLQTPPAVARDELNHHVRLLRSYARKTTATAQLQFRAITRVLLHLHHGGLSDGDSAIVVKRSLYILHWKWLHMARCLAELGALPADEADASLGPDTPTPRWTDVFEGIIVRVGRGAHVTSGPSMRDVLGTMSAVRVRPTMRVQKLVLQSLEAGWRTGTRGEQRAHDLWAAIRAMASGPTAAVGAQLSPLPLPEAYGRMSGTEEYSEGVTEAYSDNAAVELALQVGAVALTHLERYERHRVAKAAHARRAVAADRAAADSCSTHDASTLPNNIHAWKVRRDEALRLAVDLARAAAERVAGLSDDADPVPHRLEVVALWLVLRDKLLAPDLAGPPAPIIGLHDLGDPLDVVCLAIGYDLVDSHADVGRLLPTHPASAKRVRAMVIRLLSHHAYRRELGSVAALVRMLAPHPSINDMLVRPSSSQASPLDTDNPLVLKNRLLRPRPAPRMDGRTYRRLLGIPRNVGELQALLPGLRALGPPDFGEEGSAKVASEDERARMLRLGRLGRAGRASTGEIRRLGADDVARLLRLAEGADGGREGMGGLLRYWGFELPDGGVRE